MSEQPTPSTPPATPPTPAFAIQRLYLKDASFETPIGIKAFQQLLTPRIHQEIQTRNTKIAETTYEMVLTVTITLKCGEEGKEETAFIAEVQQAGIFHIQLPEEDAMKHQLGVICPSILFPYAREAIDALVIKGSFPPVLLPPVNFLAIYQQKISAAAADENKVAH